MIRQAFSVAPHLIIYRPTVTTTVFFSQSIESRLTAYDSVSSNARLRQLLNQKGGAKASVDIVEQRLSELKGTPIEESRVRESSR